MKQLEKKSHILLVSEQNSIQLLEDVEERKCKGIKKNVIKKEISFDDYKQCWFSGEDQTRTTNTIKSDKHEIYSMKMSRIALSATDDKRCVMNDKIHTKALRH